MTADRDDVERRLTALGNETPPPPAPDFVARLEARLRGGVALSQPAPDSPAPASWNRRVVAIAAVVMALLGIAVVSREGRDQAEQLLAGPVLLASASGDVVVLRPDGTTREVVAGSTLSDGDIVRTGPTGVAVVGNVQLAANEAAVVHNGNVALVALPLEETEPPSPPTSVAPSTVPRTAPPTSVPPTRVATTTTATASPAPPATYAPPPAPPIRSGEMQLALVSCRPEAHLRWRLYPGDGFSAYLVIRSRLPVRPTYPVPGDGSVEVVAIRQLREATRAVDMPPPRVGVGYLVVAVDADGRELARSNAVPCRP